MFAVRGKDDNRVVIPNVPAGDSRGAVGERDVVLSTAFFGCLGRRDDNHSAVAEAEREDGAVRLGEGVEGSVEGVFQDVEVAQDGDGRWAGRKVFRLLEP